MGGAEPRPYKGNCLAEFPPEPLRQSLWFCRLPYQGRQAGMRNTISAPLTGELAAAAPLPEGFAPSVPRNQEGFPKMICRASPQPTPKSAYAV